MTKRYNLTKSKYFLTAKISVLAVLPLILLSLPKTTFDDHSNTICLFTLLSGIECYGCGLTRACMRLIHFDVYGAWEFNKISVVVFPILCFLYLQEGLNTLKHLRARTASN
jgi:hypothetical protein